ERPAVSRGACGHRRRPVGDDDPRGGDPGKGDSAESGRDLRLCSAGGVQTLKTRDTPPQREAFRRAFVARLKPSRYGRVSLSLKAIVVGLATSIVSPVGVSVPAVWST